MKTIFPVRLLDGISCLPFHIVEESSPQYIMENFFFNYDQNIYTSGLWLQSPGITTNWTSNTSNDTLETSLFTTVTNLFPLCKYQISVKALPLNGYESPYDFSIKVSTNEEVLNTQEFSGEHYTSLFSPPSNGMIVLTASMRRNSVVNTVLDLQQLELVEITPYSLFVDVGSWNQFFTVKSYDSINHSANLILNTSYVYNVLNSNSTGVFFQDPSGADCQGFETGGARGTLGFRMLELACLKMFHNARSRYVVSNTREFTGAASLTNYYDNLPLYSSVVNQVESALISNNDVLNQYSLHSNNYVTNSPQETFDFSNMNLRFLIAYSSHSQPDIEMISPVYNNSLFQKVLVTLGEFPAT